MPLSQIFSFKITIFVCIHIQESNGSVSVRELSLMVMQKSHYSYSLDTSCQYLMVILMPKSMLWWQKMKCLCHHIITMVMPKSSLIVKCWYMFYTSRCWFIVYTYELVMRVITCLWFPRDVNYDPIWRGGS